MHVISSDVPVIYNIGSHLCFLFGDYISGELMAVNKLSSLRCFHLVLISQLCQMKYCR